MFGKDFDILLTFLHGLRTVQSYFTPTFRRHTTSGIRFFYEGRGASKFHVGDVESGIFIVNVCIEHWGGGSNHRSFRLIELASAPIRTKK